MAINSRNKGIRGEKQWAELCQQHGFEDAHRTGQFCGKTGQAADVEGLPYIHTEVKWVQNLNLREAMRQSIRDCKAEGKGNIPIVASKKNGRPWLVTLSSDGFFEIYKGYLKYQESIEVKNGEMGNIK